MPKTRTDEQETAEIEEMLAKITPETHPALDGAPWRRIIRAREAVAAADSELREAAAAARAAGYSWTVIGAVLDTTRQAAFQRFGR
jgi:tRNA A37 N6-isopentenylltransferase MiaA